MKTPMQELIEKLEEKYREYASHKGNDDWYTSVAYGIEISIKHAKSLLEKEKEVMRLMHKNGYDNSQYIHDCKYGGVEYWDSVPKPFEQYYNDTFNTKER
jgi:hypothetical protein